MKDLAQAAAAIGALHARGPRVVVAKSLSLDDTPPDALDILAGDDRGLWRLRTPNLPIAVNGAGDLFAALFFHHWLETGETPETLSRTASSVFGIVAATLASGARELAIVADQGELVAAVESLSGRGHLVQPNVHLLSCDIVAKLVNSGDIHQPERERSIMRTVKMLGIAALGAALVAPAPQTPRRSTVTRAIRPPPAM